MGNTNARITSASLSFARGGRGLLLADDSATAQRQRPQGNQIQQWPLGSLAHAGAGPWVGNATAAFLF